MSTVYQFEAQTINGKPMTLGDYQGKVLLIVNTASKCGLTPQFEGLEKLYNDYKDKGLEILGFPCNQFGHQDPGSEDEIQEFCQMNYGVSFPMHAKIEVNGENTHPLYQHLKSEAPGILGSKKIKWNFTKFLIGKNGEVIERFAPATKPEKLISAIEKALQN
ncbi:glutathione peroxidase [Oceanicoccus sp. KOV_DT_Chl]|uniref:glutathione peroxidase n=1 Tax=Oceanicoccus sp. KOV_DT_Chl TaxID=1904639 RepID=UPI000C7C26FD|nr:glutathione peroxidase [Oceanicoccus sp. KOV_DT_Chl]